MNGDGAFSCPLHPSCPSCVIPLGAGSCPRGISSCGVTWGETDPTGPFALALQGCGHPCPRHRNDNLLGLVFLMSLTNATYRPSLLRVSVGRRSPKTAGRKGGCGMAGLWVFWWVQGTLSIAELPVIHPFPFWMLVLGGCCQCLDNIYHTRHFTADDRCSYISVPTCSRKLLWT